MAAALDEVARILTRHPGEEGDFQTCLYCFSNGRADDPEKALATATE